MVSPPPVGHGTLLRHLLAQLDGDVQSIYDDLGVSFRPRFYPVVRELLRNGSASVGALAATTGVSQPAMTQTIGEMRRLGLINSTRAEDPRQRTIRLSPEGERLADRLQPVWAATAQAAAELDRELAAPLAEIMTAALAALERAPFKDRIREKLDND